MHLFLSDDMFHRLYSAWHLEIRGSIKVLDFM